MDRRGWIGTAMGAVLVSSVAMAPPPASALTQTITSPGSDFDVVWTLNVPGGQLSATALFDVLSLSSSQAQIQITVTNTTDPSLQMAINSIGFNTNPSVTASYLSAGSVFEGIGNDVNFPSFQTVEVCTYAANNCSGGAYHSLLQSGVTDQFTLLLSGNFGSTPSLTLSTFPIKFQGELGSYEFAGSAPVPEPSSVILLGAGLAGLVGWQWRRGLAAGQKT